jgi:hypothetical protein
LHVYDRGSDQREKALLDQSFTEFDAEGIVDVENGNGHAADRSAADEVGPLPAEVPCPLVALWIEQRSELARLRVEAGDVETLVAVLEVVDMMPPLSQGDDPILAMSF